MATTLAVKDWSSLHQDFISCFARRIVSMKDFYAFGGVCKSWRSAAIKENSNTALRLQHKVPILLPPKEFNAPICNFYSLTEDQINQLDLPETTGKVCYSSLGWLLTASPNYSKLDLFNPLTHAHIKLPPLTPKIIRPRFLMKFVLSSSPSSTSDYEVLLLSLFDGLAFYKPGYNDGIWTSMPFQKPLDLVDAAYYKGKFYVVDELGNVFVCEMEDPNNLQMRLVAPHIQEEQLFGPEIRIIDTSLVESATGTLLLVLRLYDDSLESSIGYRVFEVPIDTGNSWAKSEVKNLGNTTLFVGEKNSTFLIEPLDDSICKANCIYFLDQIYYSEDDHLDHVIGIYYMQDGKIDLEQLPDSKHNESSLRSYSWHQPSF